MGKIACKYMSLYWALELQSLQTCNMIAKRSVPNSCFQHAVHCLHSYIPIGALLLSL